MVQRLTKWFIGLVLFFITICFMLFIQEPQADYDIYSSAKRTLKNFPYFHDYTCGKWRCFNPNQIASLSKLGQILYLDNSPPIVDTTLKNYTILAWKYGYDFEFRFLKNDSNHRFDPFENCSVKNCRITYKDDDIKIADLVLFHLSYTKGVEELPKGQRNSQQIWTFLTYESPFQTFQHRSNYIGLFNGLFNWSMTYRMDSDIPIPYGRTIALKRGENGIEVELDAWSKTKRQDVLVAIMLSCCNGHNNRWKYIIELKKHIAVDIYGHCGPLKCPGRFLNYCDEVARYKFYLAFENSNCDEYITEKVWWNSFAKNSIPIVMGGSRISYRQFLPPNSYINVENFASPEDLAYYILYLNSTPSKLQNYFSWKKHFKVLNEHGYFGSGNCAFFCRVCEALNYNSKEVKVYENLTHFWNRKICNENWDVPKIGYHRVLPVSLPKVGMSYFQKRFEAYALFI